MTERVLVVMMPAMDGVPHRRTCSNDSRPAKAWIQYFVPSMARIAPAPTCQPLSPSSAYSLLLNKGLIRISCHAREAEFSITLIDDPYQFRRLRRISPRCTGECFPPPTSVF